jgi:hypothetical protein
METTIYSSGEFYWTYEHTSGDLPETYRLKYGTSPGVYAGYTIIPYGTNTVAVSTVLPSIGVYYVRLYTYNTAWGELNPSEEMNVTATENYKCMFTL